MANLISSQLQRTVNLFVQKKITFALAGGLVASLYRSHERMTADLDFLFLFQGDIEKAAEEVLHELGLEPRPLTKADLEGGPLHARKRTRGPVWMLCGLAKSPQQVRVDLILPIMPWTELALERAQAHRIDFGFARVPCITVEDLVVSKLYALKNRSDRFQDLDDLKEIFSKDQPFDLSYLSDRMAELLLPIPRPLLKAVPKVLVRLSKSLHNG